MDKIVNYIAIENICARLKVAGKTIIFKTGCFDIIHAGHIQLLERAKSMADILIVGIGSNGTVKRDRPSTYYDEWNRSYVIASLQCVDYVVVEREETTGNVDHALLLNLIKPDLFHIATDDKCLSTKLMLAKAIGSEAILQDPVKIFNYDQLIEPHSSKMKA